MKIKKFGVNIESRSKKNRVTHNPKVLFPVIMKVPHSERQPRGKKQVQTLSRLARQAARISTEKSGVEISEFSKNKDGVPIPTNGIYWSISHKSRYVGGVVSTEPVGIDIERVRPVKNRVMEKIASEGEWALAGGKALEAFFRFWTAKEAVLKATGAGFTGLSNCRIVQIDDDEHLIAKYAEKRFIIHQTWCAKDYIAAVTATERLVRWVFV